MNQMGCPLNRKKDIHKKISLDDVLDAWRVIEKFKEETGIKSVNSLSYLKEKYENVKVQKIK